MLALFFFWRKLFTVLFLLFCKAKNIRNLRELKKYPAQSHFFTNKKTKEVQWVVQSHTMGRIQTRTWIFQPQGGTFRNSIQCGFHRVHVSITGHSWLPDTSAYLFFLSIKYSVSGFFAFFISGFLLLFSGINPYSFHGQLNLWFSIYLNCHYSSLTPD